MRISDWSSDVCSSDLLCLLLRREQSVDDGGVVSRLCDSPSVLDTNRIVEQRFTHAADYHPVAGSFERHLGRAAIRIWPPSLDRRTDGYRALIHQSPSTRDRKSTRLNSSHQ